ncbi:MAG: cytochrome c3 family protein [Deltaproteobacteria bacterium]|nr:cytochrome c3 family protein [Deltaproteobacteria bacterium]
MMAAAGSLAAGEKAKGKPPPAPPPKSAPPAKAPPAAKGAPVKPLPPLKQGAHAPLKEKVAYVHGPFEEGDCSICHKNKDPKNPGPALDPTPELCLGCHEEYREYSTQRVVKHRPTQEGCTWCHNPHNSKQPHLLLEESSALCLRCHDAVRQVLQNGKVKHGAVEEGEKCMTCHEPHGSNIESLLVKLPFDLCVECHAKDTQLDDQGKALTNMKKLLDDNPEWHAPVAAKDCSVCHNPHASPNFRLLTSEYPARFYEPYSVKTYALCFECHNEQMAATEETTALTEFRDGKRNLHHLHVNKAERGRTCRACHEVHASKWPFHIREGVPFGNKGWILKIQYEKTATGGSCAKSCHPKRVYNRTIK